ncbi:unnamed protein product, partial [Prorocentrum cordatum]
EISAIAADAAASPPQFLSRRPPANRRLLGERPRGPRGKGPPQQGGRRRQPARPSRAEERPKRSPRGWPTVHYRGALRMAPRGPGQGAQGERAEGGGGAGGSGGEGRRRGARAGRRNAIATLRTVAAAAAPPRLGGGADTQGALPLGDPRGGGTDIILRDLGHMWASGRLVVLNRRIPVACSAGRLPRQANVRGRRGGRARAAGRGRRRRSKNSRSTRMRRRR